MLVVASPFHFQLDFQLLVWFPHTEEFRALPATLMINYEHKDTILKSCGKSDYIGRVLSARTKMRQM